MDIRLLKADEIDVRVQSISKEDKGAVLLLYKDAIGIITEEDEDIEGTPVYELLFVGEHHNKVSEKVGGACFYGYDLRGM